MRSLNFTHHTYRTTRIFRKINVDIMLWNSHVTRVLEDIFFFVTSLAFVSWSLANSRRTVPRWIRSAFTSDSSAASASFSISARSVLATSTALVPDRAFRCFLSKMQLLGTKLSGTVAVTSRLSPPRTRFSLFPLSDAVELCSLCR